YLCLREADRVPVRARVQASYVCAKQQPYVWRLESGPDGAVFGIALVAGRRGRAVGCGISDSLGKRRQVHAARHVEGGQALQVEHVGEALDYRLVGQRWIRVVGGVWWFCRILVDRAVDLEKLFGL